MQMFTSSLLCFLCTGLHRPTDSNLDLARRPACKHAQVDNWSQPETCCTQILTSCPPACLCAGKHFCTALVDR